MGAVAKVREFTREVMAEFRKVTWPTRQELTNSTVVVITVTIAFAFFLWGVDWPLAELVRRILR
jgi:preprotein translocase subunit SecE